MVGAGTMGQQIALQCAMHGYEVALYDIAPAMLETARRRIDGYVLELTQQGRLSPGQRSIRTELHRAVQRPRRSRARCRPAQRIRLEDVKTKGEVFGKFNTLCKPNDLHHQQLHAGALAVRRPHRTTRHCFALPTSTTRCGTPTWSTSCPPRHRSGSGVAAAAVCHDNRPDPHLRPKGNPFLRVQRHAGWLLRGGAAPAGETGPLRSRTSTAPGWG